MVEYDTRREPVAIEPDTPAPTVAPGPPAWEIAVRWLTAFALSAVSLVALFGNRVVAGANDAVFSQSAVLRAIRFGGTYYQNGIHPKGPLEEVAHDIAARVGGYDGHWYVISVMVAISATIIAFTAARTTRITGGNAYAALAIAAFVFIHFTLSDAAYAGLLYSRNILVTLLAAAWVITIDDRPWTGRPRSQWAASIVTGLLLGLAVQTILPSLFDAASIGVAALFLLRLRVPDRDRRTMLGSATVIAAAFAFVSAPIWYMLRGSFAEFWASWWTYASYQNTGIGQSLGTQVAKGWDYAWGYYQHRPIVFLVLAAFVAITIAWWAKLSHKLRIVHVALLGWFAGGWFQLVTGQRYSTHYFSVIAAPTAMIGAALAGHACRALMDSPRLSRTAVAWPLTAIVLAFFLSAGTARRLVDASEITSNFTSVGNDAAVREANLGPTNRSVKAVLDLVSRDEDPLLAYSENQYIYPLYRRIPATRFQQRYFLVGSIYLGRQSEKYILHDTWKWFDEDMRQANPTAFLQSSDQAVDSPQFAQYVQSHFSTAFAGKDGEVQLRNDLADSGTARRHTDAVVAPGWRRRRLACRRQLRALRLRRHRTRSCEPLGARGRPLHARVRHAGELTGNRRRGAVPLRGHNRRSDERRACAGRSPDGDAHRARRQGRDVARRRQQRARGDDGAAAREVHAGRRQALGGVDRRRKNRRGGRNSRQDDSDGRIAAPESLSRRHAGWIAAARQRLLTRPDRLGSETLSLVASSIRCRRRREGRDAVALRRSCRSARRCR